MRSLISTVVLVLAGCQCGGAQGLEVSGPLDFGDVPMGGTKTSSVTLRNPGKQPLEVTSVAGASEVFTVVDFAPAYLAPGATLSVLVRFSPLLEIDPAVTQRDHAAELTFNTDARSAALLSVTGRAVRVPCVAPQLIDFGVVVLGDTAHQRLDVAGQVLIGATGSAFTAVADAQGIALTFKPTRDGQQTGELTVRPAAHCPEVTVPLTGTGLPALLACEPVPLDFGYLTPGLTKQATLRVRNFSSAPVTLSELKALFGTSTSSEYRVLGPPTLTVPGMGEAAVTVSFTPALLGLRNGSVTATTSLSRQPTLSCPLRGTGGGPDIDISPAAIDFGRVAVFSGNGVTRKVTIRNLGTHPLPPDPLANLRISRWVVTPKNTASKLGDICVGGWDETTVTCLAALPASYDPGLGLEATANRFLDIPIRVMPSVAGTLLEWDVAFLSNDPDEPAVTINVRVQPVVLPPCSYTVTPTALAFGLLPQRGSTRSFTVTNTWADECLISSLDLDANTSPVFRLPGGTLQNFTLPAGQSLTVFVEAKPLTLPPAVVQSLAGNLTVSISSPAAPRRQVALSAQLGRGCLLVSPAPYDFGTVKQGCSSARVTFDVFNACDNPVTVQSHTLTVPPVPAGTPGCPGAMACAEVRLDGPPNFGTGNVLPPHSAMPGQFALKYQPIDLGADHGAFLLAVVEDGARVDYVVPLTGKSDALGQHSDTFVQASKPKADILMVIDNSAGMADEHQQLASNSGFGSFVRYANAAGVEWQLAFTVTDLTVPMPGALVGMPAVLTSAVPNLENVFRSRILGLGTSGSSTRGVADPAVRALSMNPSLLRDDAHLAILGVTDGPDRSPLPAAFYAGWLAGMKGRKRGELTYNIIGPAPPGFMGPSCPIDDAWPTPSIHRQLTLAFNGSHELICTTSWSVALENTGKTAFGFRTHFYLSAPAQPATLEITVDHGFGGPVVLPPTDPRGLPVWSYDAAANAIVFQPLFVPAPGDTMKVTYTPVCF